MKRFWTLLLKKFKIQRRKKRVAKKKKKGTFFFSSPLFIKKSISFVVNQISGLMAKLWDIKKSKKTKEVAKKEKKEGQEIKEEIPEEPEVEFEISPERQKEQTSRKRSLKKYMTHGLIFLSVCILGGSYGLWHLFVHDDDVKDVQNVERVNAEGNQSKEERQDYREVIAIDLMKPVKGSRLLATINPDYFRTHPALRDPHLFIIVKNIGLDSELAEDCFELNPHEVTLALNPYTPNLSEKIDEFQDNGYTVLITLPLQGAKLNEDQGPFALMSTQAGSNDARLEKFLKTVEEFDGILLDRGEIFLKNKEAVQGVQLALSRLKKLIIVPPDILENQWHGCASQIGLPTISAVVENPGLEDLEPIRHFAETAGYAIITFDLTKYDDISTINQWIKNAIDARLVPASLSKIMISS